MSRARRILLVSPVFHGYWRSISAAFESLGYDVVTHRYDAGSKPEKLWNKLRHELPGRLAGEARHLSHERVTARAIAAVRESRPDIVLVVRGDALTDDFWSEVRAVGAAPAMWLYDEIRRMHYDADTIGARAAIATYSKLDAADLRARGVDALHVPLAFDPQHAVPRRAPTGEFTMIGARFEGRERLLTAAARAGLPVRAYGRDWSNRPLDRARTWRLATSPLPAAGDLGLADAYGVMRAGLGTLNIHGDQDGFTMRTFEACGVGAVQLIDRADVAEFYEPGREVIVFDAADGADGLIEACRSVMTDPSRLAALREAAAARTLAEHTFRHRAEALQELW